MIHLYIKTHNKTGKKYLGYTNRDPFGYIGSGKYWKRHIKKHGYDVSTEIVGSFSSKEEMKREGIKLSEQYDIVNSPLWANLKNEQGDGGFDYINRVRPNEERRVAKICKAMKENPWKRNPAPGCAAAALKNKNRTWEEILGEEEAKRRRKPNSNFMKKLNKEKVMCPKCGKMGQRPAMKRWHFDKCKKQTMELEI